MTLRVLGKWPDSPKRFGAVFLGNIVAFVLILHPAAGFVNFFFHCIFTR
jgi:hypothetical protein